MAKHYVHLLDEKSHQAFLSSGSSILAVSDGCWEIGKGVNAGDVILLAVERGGSVFFAGASKVIVRFDFGATCRVFGESEKHKRPARVESIVSSPSGCEIPADGAWKRELVHISSSEAEKILSALEEAAFAGV